MYVEIRGNLDLLIKHNDKQSLRFRCNLHPKSNYSTDTIYQ